MRYLCAGILVASAVLGADPALTIYNRQFAIVRERISLRLQAGVNQIEFTGVTQQVEPESVILRDPAGRRGLRILEQNYRADPIALESLLTAYEGKTIEFQIRTGERTEVVTGRIVRAGSAAPRQGNPAYPYGYPQQGGNPPSPPIIEVGGKLRFDLPGVPLFPALTADAQLKPALSWVLESDIAGTLEAELSYASGGFNWEADYNIVQGSSTALELTGWVTITNRSGMRFEKARVKLMAGDVNKVAPRGGGGGMAGGVIGGIIGGIPSAMPAVTEKTFDEYHLYTLHNPVTLLDKESKQVEFLRARNVNAEVLYVYDGAKIDWMRYRNGPAEMPRQDSGFGAQSQTKVWTMREFVNTEANQLGMPLPKGKVRFYRRDTDGSLQFTGEDNIDHTAKGERVRVFTGAAFDLVGERKRTSFRIDHGRQSADEAFEIKVRNRKPEAAEVRVVEHLYRWTTWEIPVSSQPFVKTDAQTVEFRVMLKPNEEKTVTYAAHYQW